MSLVKSRAIVWDLDKCLANNLHREHLVPEVHDRDEQWDEWSRSCADDEPIPGAIARLQLDAEQFQVHIYSARGEIAFDPTMEWLKKHVGLGYIHNVALRARGDNREGWEIKVEYIKRLQVMGIKVVLAYDDVGAQADKITEHTGVPVLRINEALWDGIAWVPT